MSLLEENLAGLETDVESLIPAVEKLTAAIEKLTRTLAKPSPKKTIVKSVNPARPAVREG